MRKLTASLGMLVCVCLYAAPSSSADVVTDWNATTGQYAYPPSPAPARPAGSGLFDFAMVHAAMHDAIQAFEHEFETYGPPIEGASGSPVAAAATAAHDVLVVLFPVQAAAIDSTYTLYLSSRGLTGDPGVAVGQAAAANILTLRQDDGRFPVTFEPFLGGTGPGEWRPTLFLPGTTTPVPMVASWAATVMPFALKAPDQFLASPPPPHLKSGKYAKDYEEVMELGGVVSARTAEQTDLAYFYADNSVMYWNRALRSIATTYLTDVGDSGRLFALANIAMADSFITAWSAKTRWNVWRPLTAIHEGDNDGNDKTVGDPDWQSLIITPNYPDYTSGANSLSGAATTILAHFFGTDEVTFSITSNTPQAIVTTRTYERFSDAADDIEDARVYLGIHFRFADVVARRQAKHVANWTFSHILRPLP
jgi:hypothetical protein